MGEIRLRKALDDYQTIYMPYRNFADRTREEYLNDLDDFVGFLEQSRINRAGELSLPVVERYVANLETKGLAGLTRKRKVVSIRSFLTFLFQGGYIASDIGKRTILPFAESTIPHVLTQAECDRLRNACSANIRDKAIIELFLQTGIKLSELTRLTVNDIELGESQGIEDRPNRYIRILGSRGKKERVIPLNSKAYEALRDYIDVREDAERHTLFLNRFGDSLGERRIQKMLRKYVKRAGIGKAGIETLRHTFGVHHFAKGTSQKTIQEVMGYKDPRSISIYFYVAQKLIKRELEDHAL